MSSIKAVVRQSHRKFDRGFCLWNVGVSSSISANSIYAVGECDERFCGPSQTSLGYWVIIMISLILIVFGTFLMQLAHQTSWLVMLLTLACPLVVLLVSLFSQIFLSGLPNFILWPLSLLGFTALQLINKLIPRPKLIGLPHSER